MVGSSELVSRPTPAEHGDGVQRFDGLGEHESVKLGIRGRFRFGWEGAIKVIDWLLWEIVWMALDNLTKMALGRLTTGHQAPGQHRGWGVYRRE